MKAKSFSYHELYFKVECEQKEKKIQMCVITLVLTDASKK